MIKPDLAKQLADIKREKKELKLEVKQLAFEKTVEVKQLQLEKEQELEKLEAEIKEKIKEEALPERVITQTEMLRSSQGIDAFKKKLVETSEDTIQDYIYILHGVFTFQEIFKRDFTTVYEEDKVCVIDKFQPNIGYYINNAPSHEMFFIDNKYWNGFSSILDCIPIYFKAFKKCITKEGFKTEYFKLDETDKKELEEWIRQEITWKHSNS
jgi:glutaredoxin